MSRIINNYIGQKFGKLTVMEYVDHQHGKSRWLCKCDCGGTHIAYACHMISGTQTSCGCLRRGGYSHGHKVGGIGSPTYRSWNDMLQRCNNKNDTSYHNYGGRGIAVCERWKTFKNFLEDMGVKPAKRMSIDRIDVNGNYEPNNCRWVTSKEQANNTRNTIWLLYDGVKYPQSILQENLGVSYPVLQSMMRSKIVQHIGKST